MTRARLAVLCALLAASGCGGGANTQPAVTIVDPVAASTLQFAVGIATISSGNGSVVSRGLNVVETLRQANGLSAVLYDVPTITGPSAFSITTSTVNKLPLGTADAGSDVGTNRISQATLNIRNYVTFFAGPLASGYTQSIPTAGAFGYGLCDCNANSGPVNGIAPLYVAYGLPIYSGNGGTNLQQFFYGGPPAFPSPSPEIAQAGFSGYSLGFTDFAVAPVLGAYRIDVAVPPTFDTSVSTSAPTLSTTSQLTSLTGLPAFAKPTFAADNQGGGTIGVNVPAGATETLVFVEADPVGASSTTPLDACNAAHRVSQFFTMLVSGNGAQTATLPVHSICSGQPYKVYAAAFDYPAYESAYPQNLAPAPPIASASGQADISTSDSLSGNYP